MDPNVVLEWKPVNDLLIAGGESYRRASQGCQQVSLQHSWQRSQSWLQFGIIHVLWLYLWTEEEDAVAVWLVCNSSCVAEVWSSAGQHLPQAQILRVTHCCCLHCLHGLSLIGVNSRYCHDPNSVLCFQWSCCQCITSVPWNLNLCLVQTQLHVALASSCLL